MGYGIGFIVWIVLCIVLANAGNKRKIGGAATFFISLFFSPIVGFIVVMVSDEKPKPVGFIVVWKDGREAKMPFSNIIEKGLYIHTTLGGSFEVRKKINNKEYIKQKDFNTYLEAKNYIIGLYK